MSASVSNIPTRRTVVTTAAVALAGCSSLFNHTRSEAPSESGQSDVRAQTTPSGDEFELSMTVANCEGVELVVHNATSGDSIANGTDMVEATLERGEDYIIEARRHDRRIEAFHYRAVGKPDPELYLERCSA